MNKQNHLLNHFWQGIITGEYVSLTDAEIDRIVSEEFFGCNPIRELTTADRKAVEMRIRPIIEENLNKKTFPDLVSNEISYFNPGELSDLLSNEFEPHKSEKIKKLLISSEKNPHLLYLPFTGSETNKKLWNDVIKLKPPLSIDEKVELLSNPDVWLNSQVTEIDQKGRSHQNMGCYGNRPLYFHDKPFLAVVKRVQQATDKKEIHMLDVGGSMGLALYQAKQLVPDIQTHNLTIDYTPGMYYVNYLHPCPAERMPSEFKEAMDLIVSNMSFGYFEAPDLALRNCVEALTVGGEAILSITPYDGWRKDKVERLWTELENVEMLEKKGILSLEKYNLWTGERMNSISEGKNSMPSNHVGNGESAVCPYVSLNIKKLESITD